MNNSGTEWKTPDSAMEKFTVAVEENVRLNVIRFTPENPKSNVPVVMLTGLGTLIDNFSIMISSLAERMPILYVETREKKSSLIEGKASFDFDTQSKDLLKIINHFELEGKKYFLLGHSYGASLIAHSYSSLNNKPAGIIFMEPTPVFGYPKWSLILIRYFSTWLYPVILPFAKWYLGHFYINKKEDQEMAAFSSKSLDNSDPKKLRRAILDIAGYEIWDRLKAINCESLVVGTSKDGLHNKIEVERMVQMLENSSFIDLETNLRTHSVEMGEIAFQFFQNLSTEMRLINNTSL